MPKKPVKKPINKAKLLRKQAAARKRRGKGKKKKKKFPPLETVVQGPFSFKKNVVYNHKYLIAYECTLFNKTIDDYENICSWAAYNMPPEYCDLSKPFVSFIAPAIRDYYYEDFYNFIIATNNNIAFEIIFVGNKPPIKTMPSNFKYIYSEESPSKCLEIAARNAVGEYLIPCSDDSIYAPQFVCHLWNWQRRDNMLNSLLTWRYVENGVIDDLRLIFDADVEKNTYVGCGGMFKREDWYRLGGVDSRFNYPYNAVVDMQLRFYEDGYNPYSVNMCFVVQQGLEDENIIKLKDDSKTEIDKELLISLWVKDSAVSKNRLDKVESFEK